MDIPTELRNCGLKATLPTLRILSLFQESDTKRLTADAVFRVLHSERIEVGMATVYRVLMQFVDAGILLRSQFESAVSVFELNHGSHHDHLVCTSCGRMEEFFDSQIEQRQEDIARERGFSIKEHSLSLYGTCAACTGSGAVTPHRRAPR